LLVNDDLMVVPAEGDQIVRICAPALAPGEEMMDLESTGAVTALTDTGVSVSVEDGPA
jgi:hypothetical protein